jgi:hypothetical protein
VKLYRPAVALIGAVSPNNALLVGDLPMSVKKLKTEKPGWPRLPLHSKLAMSTADPSLSAISILT